MPHNHFLDHDKMTHAKLASPRLEVLEDERIQRLGPKQLRLHAILEKLHTPLREGNRVAARLLAELLM